MNQLPSQMHQVRRAVPEDIPLLAEIFLCGRIHAFPWCDPSCFQMEDFIIQTEGEIIHVAVDASGLPIGFIAVWQQESFIHHLYVAPMHQRQGVGTQLLSSLKTWLPLPYRLKCVLNNAPARRFYLRAGWKDVSLGEDVLGPYALMEYNP